VLEAQLLHTEGIVRANAGDAHGAVAKLRKAVEAWNLVSTDATDLIETEYLLGRELSEIDRYDEAATHYTKAVELATRRWGATGRRTLVIREERATNELDRMHYVEARNELVEVARQFTSLYGENEDVSDANQFICQADVAARIETGSCDAALAIALRVYGDRDVRLIPSLDLVGRERIAGKDYAGAIAVLERALALDGPSNHPVAAADLAIALHRAHRSPERVAKLAAVVRDLLPEDAQARRDLEAELKR
jgi:tetratricopeptide (TPR) repeat protein